MIIDIFRDTEVKVWIAVQDDIGLVLEDTDLSKLILRIQNAVPELCQLNDIEKYKDNLLFRFYV